MEKETRSLEEVIADINEQKKQEKMHEPSKDECEQCEKRFECDGYKVMQVGEHMDKLEKILLSMDEDTFVRATSAMAEFMFKLADSKLSN